MNIFKKIWQKIKELWEKANILEKFGLGIVVFILIVIKILKLAIIFKICSSGLIWLWGKVLHLL